MKPHTLWDRAEVKELDGPDERGLIETMWETLTGHPEDWEPIGWEKTPEFQSMMEVRVSPLR